MLYNIWRVFRFVDVLHQQHPGNQSHLLNICFSFHVFLYSILGTPISTQTFSYTDHLSKQRSFYGIHVSFLLLVRLIGDIKTGRRLSRAPCSMSSPPAEYQRGFDTEIIGRNPADGYPSAFL